MSADMRLSDAERDEAIDALSEHVRTGRLDIEEFGTRSAKASAARTRGELVPLFADLPAPRPTVLNVLNVPNKPNVPGVRARPAPARRFTSVLVPIAALVALVLFFTVARVWLVFLLPAVVTLLVAGRDR